MAEIRLAHSSDIHVDDRHGTAGLRAVLATARALGAHVALLAGDTFESNQLPQELVERAAAALAEAGMPVMILPGNHDPAMPGSVYLRGAFAHIGNVSVIGVTHQEAVLFPEFELEIWGHAHRDYFDMKPLRGPRPRRTRHQVAVAHGHYEPPENLATPLRPSWIFSDPEIAATLADYLALGHWDRSVQVGDGAVPAYYSGSPDLARTVNLVRFGAGRIAVTREQLLWEE
jgi:DNA repair exonuclease SbcCD nuclease subunit